MRDLDPDIKEFLAKITPEACRAYNLTGLPTDELVERNILGDHVIPDGTEPAPNLKGLEDRRIV